jgi:hypothetical protein
MPWASVISERLPPCLPRSTGLGPATSPAQGRLGDAPIHAEVVEFKTEPTVVGGEGELVELFHDAGGDPLVAAATQRARRAGLVADALVGAAEHQNLKQLVEHDPVRDARAVAAQRVRGSMSW